MLFCFFRMNPFWQRMNQRTNLSSCRLCVRSSSARPGRAHLAGKNDGFLGLDAKLLGLVACPIEALQLADLDKVPFLYGQAVH